MTATAGKKQSMKKKKSKIFRKQDLPYHLMMLPGVLLLLIFHYLPMGGIIMAFQDFVPAKGFLHSEFVGLENFRYMFSIPDSWAIFRNTMVIAIGKIILGMIVPIVFALLLNEIGHKFFKNVVQTIVYLPNFISWVVLGSIFTMILSQTGLANQFLGLFGIDPIPFLASNKWFQPLMVGTHVWKGYGYGTIIYLASITSINPALYESASMDGANRWQQILKITLPGIAPTIVLVATLNLGGILNAGFDQIFNMYNPLVYDTGDIIDTYVYRMGLQGAQYSFGAAVGLMKSVISFFLIVTSYKLADKYAGYRLF